MWDIQKNINIKQKFGKYIYTETIIALLIATVILYITSLIFTNFFLKNTYILFGLFITFLFMIPSSRNPDKKLFDSVVFYHKRYKGTVYSIDKISEMKNLSKEEKKELKNAKKEEKKKQKKTKKECKKTSLDYIDFINIDEEKNFIRHKNKDCIEILEIEPISLNNITRARRDELINRNGSFYLSYSYDIKIIYLNYPNTYTEQKYFLNKKIENEKDEFKKYMLKIKLEELEILEEHRYKKAFYMVVFGKSEIDLFENVKRIKENFPLRLLETDRETKEKIYFKLNNLNSRF